MENTLNKILSKKQLKESILTLFENGLPTGYNIGVSNIDELIRWETGRLSIITGVPNFGKSEFLDFVNIQLNKLYGWKTLYFSPENFPISYHLQKLVSKVTNKPFNKNNINSNEIIKAIDYITDNFFFLNYETVSTLDDILNSAQELIVKENIKVLVIDPYNRLEHLRPNNLNETEYISKLMDMLSNFAKRNNILIHLVAHPRKMQSVNGVLSVPNYYDINGSANFANKADYCLTVHRDKINNLTEIHIQKVKFKNLGCQGIALLKYDLSTGNYYNAENDIYSPLDNIFDLDKHSIDENKEKIREAIKEAINKNVLDVNVSLYQNHFSKEGKEVNLYQFLKQPIEGINLDEWRLKLDFKQIYKPKLPCVTPSGLFGSNHSLDNLIKHSGLLVIDIDKKDQTNDMSVIYNQLIRLDNIAYLGKSCSGTGLFGIMPIADITKHKEHFLAIEKDLKDKGIIIDKSCKDITRLRYYSYDPDAYFNEKAIPYTSTLIGKQKQYNYDNTKINTEDEKLNKVIEDIQKNHINIAESYDNWRDIAAILYNEFEEKGRTVFHIISSQSKKYDKNDTDEMFDKISEYEYEELTIATLYYLYNEAKSKMNNNKIN